MTGGTLTLDIGNQYLVEVSPDNQTWTTVLEATGLTGDTGLTNRAERSLDLNDLRGASQTLYVRVSDELSAGRLGRLAGAREARAAALSARDRGGAKAPPHRCPDDGQNHAVDSSAASRG